ncbi:hypothetical protein DFJ73DRAFT_116510 [Zopfochytrium polystomum]|nr:hypothetical protein DFJ73DRAFT_116510 [Zopfochytrium polystomum]
MQFSVAAAILAFASVAQAAYYGAEPPASSSGVQAPSTTSTPYNYGGSSAPASSSSVKAPLHHLHPVVRRFVDPGLFRRRLRPVLVLPGRLLRRPPRLVHPGLHRLQGCPVG